MKIYPAAARIIIIAGLSGALYFLATGSISNKTQLLRELRNAGHTPLFGVMTLLLLWLAKLGLGSWQPSRHLRYFVVLCSAGMIAVLTEVIQYFSIRDADIGDLIRNFAGISSFLALAWSIRSRRDPVEQTIARRKRYLIRGLGAGILIIAMAPLCIWKIVTIQRDAAFPRICCFESLWESKWLETKDAKLETVAPPALWKEANGNRVGRLTFEVASYPGLTINEPGPDWREYDLLAIDIFSELEGAVTIALRVNDLYHNNEFTDRYNTSLVIAPGSNQIRIPLNDLRTAPESREMNLGRINAITLFAIDPGEEFSLYLDNIGLLRAR